MFDSEDVKPAYSDVCFARLDLEVLDFDNWPYGHTATTYSLNDKIGPHHSISFKRPSYTQAYSNFLLFVNKVNILISFSS